jgi:hypothetical protein
LLLDDVSSFLASSFFVAVESVLPVVVASVLEFAAPDVVVEPSVAGAAVTAF